MGWGISLFILFPRGISLKVNVIVQLEFELAHYTIAVQYISHYVMAEELG